MNNLFKDYKHNKDFLSLVNYKIGYKLHKFISNKNHIFQDIINSKIIIGINTIALVLGLLAKRKAISCIPSKKQCELPHKEIISFTDLLNDKKKFN